MFHDGVLGHRNEQLSICCPGLWCSAPGYLENDKNESVQYFLKLQRAAPMVVNLVGLALPFGSFKMGVDNINNRAKVEVLSCKAFLSSGSSRVLVMRAPGLQGLGRRHNNRTPQLIYCSARGSQLKFR